MENEVERLHQEKLKNKDLTRDDYWNSEMEKTRTSWGNLNKIF